MDKSMLSDLLDDIKLIAVEAGQIIMEVYEHADFHIAIKKDNSPLTLADKKANDLICARLHQVNPDIPIISEENKLMPYEVRKDYQYCWMVDPLDGTKEFIKQNGEFTVNIAMIHQGESIMGVVYAPALRKLYWAMKGEGAYLLYADEITELCATEFTNIDKGLRVVCSRSHLNEGTQQFIDSLSEPEKVSKGSSLKFLILAEGGAELYPRLAPTMEWDTAAAQIILEEAGGGVLIAGSEEPVRYNKENLLNPYFLAKGKELHG